MKKKFSLPLFFIFLAFFYSVTHLSDINQITAKTFLDVLDLFYSIFFWVLLFSIGLQYHFFYFVGKLFYPIFYPILKLNEIEISIYIASMFAGYPSYVKLIKNAPLSKDSQSHLMKFCSHPSFGFVVNVIGIKVFNNIKLGYLLFLIQLISNFIIAFLCRKYDTKEFKKEFQPSHKITLIDFLKSQFKAIFEIFIYIFGFMLVFRIIIFAFPIKNIFITGLFEFSQACIDLYAYPKKYAFILCSFFLSFSSLSVICQSISILDGDISLSNCLKIRFLQAIISSFIAYLFTFILF